MFKGPGVLPQRAAKPFVATQTLLAQLSGISDNTVFVLSCVSHFKSSLISHFGLFFSLKMFCLLTYRVRVKGSREVR